MRSTKIFYAGLMLSPLDSFPIFKSISTYAPFISVALFAIYYFIEKEHRISYKFQLNRFIILLAIVITILYSLFNGILIYHDLHGFVNYLIQLLAAIILYKSFNCYFIKLQHENYTETFANLFIKASVAILIIGLVELVLFPYKGIYSSFVSLFSWRVTPERLQLVSGEPAWATRFLLTLIAILPFAKLRKRKKVQLYSITIILLFATGSTLGLLCVAIYFLITYFKKKYLKYYFALFVIAIFFAPIILEHMNPYTRSRIETLLKLESSDIETIAVEAGSGSIMARLGNPVLAVNMGMDNPALGVGGGYYYMHHYPYLSTYFPRALKIKNVYETGVTAKNLIARILAENGVLVWLMFVYILLWLYRAKARKCYYLKGVFVAMILLTFNFDSLFHIYPLLLFCFLLNIPPKKESHESLYFSK